MKSRNFSNSFKFQISNDFYQNNQINNHLQYPKQVKSQNQNFIDRFIFFNLSSIFLNQQNLHLVIVDNLIPKSFNSRNLMEENSNPQNTKPKIFLVLSQMKAIVINNIIVNNRILLFWKEIMVIAAILGVAIIQQQTQPNSLTAYSPKQVITIYNILAVVFVARSSVMVHMDNRKKFIYFQKAYGINTLAYTLTWVLYSLIIGSLKFFFYILLVYIYLQINSERYQPYFRPYGIQNENFFINFAQYCIATFLSYFSVYAYFLLMVVIIEHNQIGLKLMTPFIVVSIIYLDNFIFDLTGMLERFSLTNPIGWLTVISSYRQVYPFAFYKKETYILIFLYQFFGPLTLAIIIECIKIKRFQIRQAILSGIRKLKRQIKSKLMTELLTYQSQFKSNELDQLLIMVKDVSKVYGKKTILSSINLAILKRDIVLLCGLNGSGKSTLLKILTKTQHLSSGNIFCPQEIRFGVSLEENYFEETLTVKQNIIFYAKLKGVAVDTQILQRFELVDFADKEYFKISGGNRKKLSLACAFLGDNDVVLLDEPTMGIDFAVRREIDKIIQKEIIRKPELAIIISTCNIKYNSFEQINKVWILEKGEIILNETIQNIKNYSNFVIAEIRLVAEKMNEIQQLCKEVQKMESISPQLETNMLRLKIEQNQLPKLAQLAQKYNLVNEFSFSLSNVQDKINSVLFKFMDDQEYCARKQAQLEALKETYSNMQVYQNFSQLFISSIMIRSSQIAPTILDLLYFLVISFLGWEYFRWILNFQDQTVFSLFVVWYPLYCNFMYTDFAVSHLTYKESHYQNVIFKMGMKKIPYWLATYLINMLLMFIPSIICVAVIYYYERTIKQVTVVTTIFLVFQFCFLALSLFITIIFKSSYVCFSFISIFLSIIDIYFQGFQKTNGLPPLDKTDITLIKMFVPYFKYSTSSDIFGYAPYLYGSATYFVLFFIVEKIIYLVKNFKWNLNSKEVQETVHQGVIQEKLKVINIVNQNEYNQNSAIVLSSLYLKYSKKQMGIKGLNLIIEKGGVLCLLGMNGSGKSTTLKLITNETFKTFGNIFFDSKEITSETSQIYQQISISPQFNYLIDSMSVWLHLRTICLLKGVQFSRQRDLIELLLSLFDLQQHAKTKIKNLSGGNRRKMKFITALIGKSKYLLMDQPTLGIDPSSERIFGKILKYLTKQQRCSCIYVTHHLNEAQKHCSKLAIMKKGELILADSSANLIKKYSRGFKLDFFSNSLDFVEKQVSSAFKEKISVYQCTKAIELNLLRVLIPYEKFKFDICMDLILSLKQKGIIFGYSMKSEKLSDVFNYLIHKTEQSNLWQTE